MICVALSEKKSLADIGKFNLAELRLDMLKLSNEEIADVFSKNRCLIATCRETYYSRDERLLILKNAVLSGASYVDVEIESDASFKSEIIPLAKTNNCKVIVSYHNYDGTPSIDDLENVISDSLKDGADIVKITTFAHTPEDSARILSLYSVNRPRPLAAFCMGEAGKITRVACVRLGAPFTYASYSDASRTASGQIYYEDMRCIFERL